ncbi:MAG: CPBP family intramembrane metalloprotease [Chloroflexota bacterium]|nr:CPBP family intramembrane metalloprotease [Chloroflexota bacterium]
MTELPPSISEAAPASGRFSRRFWPLFLLGLPGIATLPLVLVPMLREQPLPPEMPQLPLPVLVALSMINPVLYLAGGVALGAGLAPRLGLVSLVALRAETGVSIWPRLRAQAPLAIGAGLGLSAVTVLLDAAFQPYLGDAWREAAAKTVEPGTLGALLSGLLYGGITEELMVRWGLLSLFAWAAWRLFQRGRATPSAAVLWSAVLLSAVLFGLGHLPAVSALVPLTPMIVLRTIALNALGGFVFGWLFWKRSLEAAMLAHASGHIGCALLTWTGLA